LGSSRSQDGAVVNILPIEFFIVACSFVRFHTFLIVNNYIDISRKMNYNRNLQFGQDNGKYNKHISTHFNEYPVSRARKVWRYDLLAHGFEPSGAEHFLLYISYWHFEGYVSQTVQDSR